MKAFIRPGGHMPMWFLPLAMAGWNWLFLAYTLLYEGRFKPNVFRFAIGYSLSILPALKGDLEPFVQVFYSAPIGPV